MSTNTTNMAMGKAVDGDNAKTYLETTLGAALDKIDAHSHGTDATGLAVTRFSSTTDLTARRLKAAGTSLANGDFGFSGWGSGAVGPTAGSNSTDTRGTVSATAGSGASANSSTITLTFKDGTWTTAPIVLASITAPTGVILSVVPTISATQVTFTVIGTVVNGSAYTISWIVIG